MISNVGSMDRDSVRYHYGPDFKVECRNHKLGPELTTTSWRRRTPGSKGAAALYGRVLNDSRPKALKAGISSVFTELVPGLFTGPNTKPWGRGLPCGDNVTGPGFQMKLR